MFTLGITYIRLGVTINTTARNTTKRWESKITAKLTPKTSDNYVEVLLEFNTEVVKFFVILLRFIMARVSLNGDQAFSIEFCYDKNLITSTTHHYFWYQPIDRCATISFYEICVYQLMLD